MTAVTSALIAQCQAMLSLLAQQALRGSGFTESEWLVVRIADHLAVAHVGDRLADAVNDRTGAANGEELVAELVRRGFIEKDRVDDLQRPTIERTQQRIDSTLAPLWSGLAPDDIAATNRVLRELLNRARLALGREPLGPPQR